MVCFAQVLIGRQSSHAIFFMSAECPINFKFVAACDKLKLIGATQIKV